MNKSIIACTAIALIISGCSGSSIKDINDGLSAVNSGLSALSGKPLPQKNAAQQNTIRHNNAIDITPAQERKLMASLNQNTKDQNINNAITEATPVISSFIKLRSCLPGYNVSTLNQFAAPGKSFHDGGPVPRMHYHDKSSCATVLRIHGWSMPAKNALRFETTYISDNSGESISFNNEIVKQPNGEWLFVR